MEFNNSAEFIEFAKSILPNGREEIDHKTWIVSNINNSVRFSLVSGYGSDIYMLDIDNISIHSWNFERFKNQVQKVLKLRDEYSSANLTHEQQSCKYSPFIPVNNLEDKQKILKYLVENDNISPNKLFENNGEQHYISIEPQTYRTYVFSETRNLYRGRSFIIRPKSYDQFIYLFENLTEIMADENQKPVRLY